MAKPLKYKELEVILIKANCRSREGRGSHTIWYCSCGRREHMVSIVSGHGTVSPAVLREASKKLCGLELAA